MNITNDLVTEYINGFYKPTNEFLGKLRIQAEEERVPIILKETESFLKVLLSICKPMRILEIGCAIGYSAIFFSEVSGGNVITIEKSEDMYNKALKNISDADKNEKIKVLLGDGQEEIEKLILAGEKPFDLIFIDAAKSHYKRFFDASLKLCHKDTIILSDNALMKAQTCSDIYDPYGKHKTNIRKMREYLEYISTQDGFNTSILSCGDGLAITTIDWSVYEKN